jgi:hypothetical protein
MCTAVEMVTGAGFGFVFSATVGGALAVAGLGFLLRDIFAGAGVAGAGVAGAGVAGAGGDCDRRPLVCSTSTLALVSLPLEKGRLSWCSRADLLHVLEVACSFLRALLAGQSARPTDSQTAGFQLLRCRSFASAARVLSHFIGCLPLSLSLSLSPIMSSSAVAEVSSDVQATIDRVRSLGVGFDKINEDLKLVRAYAESLGSSSAAALLIDAWQFYPNNDAAFEALSLDAGQWYVRWMRTLPESAPDSEEYKHAYAISGARYRCKEYMGQVVLAFQNECTRAMAFKTGTPGKARMRELLRWIEPLEKANYVKECYAPPPRGEVRLKSLAPSEWVCKQTKACRDLRALLDSESKAAAASFNGASAGTSLE